MRKTTSQAELDPLPRVVFDPPCEDWPDTGVYQLWLWLSGDVRVTVGRLGRFLFPAGTYIYTGRCCRALRARVLRHVQGATIKHWHIDYLLADRRAHVLRVGLASADPEMECELNQSIGRRGRCIVRGFGASDCTDGCEAHLFLVHGFEDRVRE